MILILTNKNRHTSRLKTGLSCANKNYIEVLSEIIPDRKYDLVLVDPTYSYDVFSKIRYDKIGFFDCEDDPMHFEAGPAYSLLKDKVSFYAKMNYVDNDRNDNIENIAFPIEPYFRYAEIAKTTFDCPKKFEPFFVGTPTYIGRYIVKSSRSIRDVKYIAEFENTNEYMYNQRYQWLMSLIANSVPYKGGIVFGQGNLDRVWQTKYFGNVQMLETSPISIIDYLKNLVKCGIGLCPTGHERLSWRHFDIMSTGSIMIRTDHKNQKWLYNPKEYITIRDDEDLATQLNELIDLDLTSLWKSHQVNRDVLAGLTPERVWKDFMDQIQN